MAPSAETLSQDAGYLRLLQTIALATNEAATLEEALQQTLDAVCAHTGWPVGHVYLIAEDGTGELVTTGIWHLDDPEYFAPLVSLSTQLRFRAGHGMPGRVLASGRPTWIPSVDADTAEHPRRDIAVDLGVTAGMAFPLLTGKEVVGVLEFMSTAEIDPEDRILEVTESMGTLLGRAVERVRGREALERSERRLRQIIDLVPHMVFAKSREGHFLLANRAVAEAYGLPVRQLVGRSHRAVHSDPEEVERMLAVDQAVIQSGRPEVISGEAFTNAKGERLLLDTVKIPFTESGSNEPAILGVAIDITERTRAEEERRRLEARMLQAQKLESLAVLAGGIAHDFNNLLTGIRINTGSAQRKLEADHPLQRELAEVEQGALLAAHLTGQLLAYAGGGRFDVRALDLSAQIRSTEALLRTSMEKRADLVLELADDLSPIDADATQLQQVLMNLAINAAEAIEGGGTVYMRTRSAVIDTRDVARQVPGGALDAGPHVVLEVEDDGCGMDPETRRRIFDPFFSTKTTGHGLGLAATLGIVHAHGGGIIVRSRSGEGTTFSAYFPESEHALEAAREVAEADPSGHGVVLVVDDDEYVLRAATLALDGFGYTAIPALGGRVGLEIFAARADEIDAVVLDLLMPGIGGEEVFHEMRAIRPDARILVSTGYSAADELPALYGSAGVLPKPYDPEELASAVKRVLGHVSRGPIDKRPEPIADFDEELAALRREYGSRLPEKLSELADHLQEHALERARRLAHTLKGTSGSYGFDEVSALLQEVDSQLEGAIGDADSWDELAALVERAKRALEP